LSHPAIVFLGLDTHIKPRAEWEMGSIEGIAQERTIQNIASGMTEDVSDCQMP